MIYLFAQCGCARPLPGWFPHHGFLWIQFIAPAIELTPRYSQLLCQCHDVLASSQSLHSHLPEVLRIPSLCHLQFLSCKVCLVLLSHFWGSLHSKLPLSARRVESASSAVLSPVVSRASSAEAFSGKHVRQL